MSNNKIKLAITHGDINGVGYEVIIKTFSDNRMMDVCTPILYGSSNTLPSFTFPAAKQVWNVP